MQNFKGIDLSVLGLLEMNRFNNSKAFYDEHKEEIKQKARVPLQQLAMDMAQQMYEIDPNFYIEPTRMVSRIRRDTRFSKDKSLYRQNVWMMFRHKKNDLHRSPGFWLEYTPYNYSYGVGYLGCTPDFMEVYRQVIREKPQQVAEMVVELASKGYIIEGDRYKRGKEGCPFKELEPIYNAKELYVIKYSTDLTRLASPDFLQEFSSAVKDLEPMYRFLNFVHERYMVARSEASE